MTETEINKTIADNLALIRKNTFTLVQGKKKLKRKHLTQTEVGNAINVTFQQVQKFEKGKNNISSAKLKILANFFGLPVGKMFEPMETYYKEIGVDNESTNNVVLDN